MSPDPNRCCKHHKTARFCDECSPLAVEWDHAKCPDCGNKLRKCTCDV